MLDYKFYPRRERKETPQFSEYCCAWLVVEPTSNTQAMASLEAALWETVILV